MDQVLCLPRRTAGVAVGKIQQVKLEPGKPFPRLRTQSSLHRLSLRPQAAARRWGSDSEASQSPGYQVLFQPWNSYPEDLLRIHLASSNCQPFLVKSCKIPASKRRVTKEDYFQYAVPRILLLFLNYLVAKSRGVAAKLFPDSIYGLHAGKVIKQEVNQFLTPKSQKLRLSNLFILTSQKPQPL